jgi:hypothetical protein
VDERPVHEGIDVVIRIGVAVEQVGEVEQLTQAEFQPVIE